MGSSRKHNFSYTHCLGHGKGQNDKQKQNLHRGAESPSQRRIGSNLNLAMINQSQGQTILE